jgi:hypothetical protein
MPGFGRASIDRAGELDGRHLAADYQQADLALDPAHSGRASRDNDGARSNWLGGAHILRVLSSNDGYVTRYVTLRYDQRYGVTLRFGVLKNPNVRNARS